VLPFLLLLAFADLSRYTHFVKLHTKRSPHLTEGASWFSCNVEILAGNKKMTDAIFQLIDPGRTGIYGVESRTLRDHFRNNRHWLEALLGKKGRECQGTFIPGTMFAGSAEFLRRLAALNLHLHDFEEEKGQLDGCLVHALERYFGYFAQSSGGECCSFEELLAGRRGK
jgi:lipopolysaccharide biosynthesis protein